MLSDEEKKAIEILKLRLENASLYVRGNNEVFYNALGIVLKLIEKQQKEIEELKENIHLKEVYVLKTNDYIKGTNVEDELCNKKWKDKIKAEIEESELLIDNSQGCMSDEDLYKEYGKIEFGKSLLEKE